jgi:ATP-dependent DNA helicase RecG
MADASILSSQKMYERTLDTDVQFLKGVGPRNAQALRKAGLATVRDVLFHLPRRYEDRRNLPPMSGLRPGQWATVRGKVLRLEAKPTRGGMVILTAHVTDGTGTVTLTWFNQPWIRRALEHFDGEVVAYGKVEEGNWACQIKSPEWEAIGEDDDAEEFARIVPVYPLVEGLSQKVVRRAVASSLRDYLEAADDPLPAGLLAGHGFRPLRWCLEQIHQPSSDEEREEARRRLVFEEFLYLQVALAMRRAATQQEVGISYPIDRLLRGHSGTGTEDDAGGSLFTPDRLGTHAEPLWDQIARMLPFELTGAQRRVVQEIWSDMKLGHPMNRLVQGDVGSGKTAVAACAMLAAVRSGYQASLMAPTEILAEQHAVNLQRLFEPLGIETVLLVGKQTAAQKKKAVEQTRSGQASIAVGTHALIQEGVEFRSLGLVVIDEQHRFGVLQRAALRQKGIGNPDVLVMTATPIPRTLTMTHYGDLDLSVIDELPPGRKPVKTHWKQPFERKSVHEGVRKLVEEGRQAYFVCPMVSESEKMLAQAAEDLHLRLSTGTFSEMKVGLLHGQMKAKEKEETMDAFRKGEVQILVSTTVIEVGVDVPNASVMVIEDANRFGLSQLHQLRGRVGRGEFQSYCILVADAKNEEARARMEVMTGTNDGFKIAEEDLKLRGPGEIAGTRQSGNLDFKIADLVQDGRMLEVARQAAMDLVAQDPELKAPEHAHLLARARERRPEIAVIAVS